jgi:hypothetical protein
MISWGFVGESRTGVSGKTEDAQGVELPSFPKRWQLYPNHPRSSAYLTNAARPVSPSFSIARLR